MTNRWLTFDVDGLVRRAQQGDGPAYGELVRRTQNRARAVARAVLRDPIPVEDVVQDAYLTAFRRLHGLRRPDAFEAWLMFIVRHRAIDAVRRRPWLSLGDDVTVPDTPSTGIDDERWRALSGAILSLNAEERRTFERFYVGRWSTARIAEYLAVKEATVRKRLERIRKRLKTEIEMNRETALSDRVVELLARPLLHDLPDNPVGAVWQQVRRALPTYELIDLPERVDLSRLAGILGVPIERATPYATFSADHPDQIIRADLTAPLLVALAEGPRPTQILAGGRVYRPEQTDATHLQGFHQAEFLTVGPDENPWSVLEWLGPLLERLSHGASMRIEPHNFVPVTEQAWEVWVLHDGAWLEVGAWGVFRPEIAQALGYDAEVKMVGGGLGLERLAAMAYGIDDIRKMGEIKIAPSAS